jgi:Holliday junction resolvase RusA-like endonuclease
MKHKNKIKLILPGSIRSKKNSKRIVMAGKYSKLIPSKAYLAWEKQAREYAQVQLRGSSLISDPVHVQVIAYYRGRKPDLSGVLESVGDCLEGIVWENDSQIMSWDGSRLVHDKEKPRTEVQIYPQ